jgi:hypothetical protein
MNPAGIRGGRQAKRDGAAFGRRPQRIEHKPGRNHVAEIHALAQLQRIEHHDADHLTQACPAVCANGPKRSGSGIA